MNLNELPTIFEVLKEEGLNPVSVIEGDKVICSTQNGEKYLMKDCRGTEEDIFTKVFPAIDRLGLKFKTLVLPKHLKVISKNTGPEGKKRTFRFIFIKFYDGVSFNQLWNEVSPDGYGGRAVEPNLSEKVISLLEDFSLIDVADLSNSSLPTFNFNDWRSKNFPLIVQNLMQKGAITQDQINRASNIFNSANMPQGPKMIFTNGDFYPRNFIQTAEGKIVVIDWEGRIDYEGSINSEGKVEKFIGQRNVLINYLENHAAFFFVHMWGNYKIQKDFISGVTKKFNIPSVSMQRAIMIKSLEQALAFGGGYLTIRQLEIFVNSLDEDYVKDLMN